MIPEIDHTVRHLPFPRAIQQATALEAVQPEIDALMADNDPRASALGELHAYQTWRQGDDGSAVRVGSPTSKRDAERWARELESHGHKQIYWVSRAN